MRTLLAVLVVFVGACGGDTDGGGAASSPTPREKPATSTDLAGEWQRDDGPHKAIFYEDGTFVVDENPQLIYTAHPAAKGTFEVDDGAITFTSKGSEICQPRDTWVWEASLLDDDRLRTVVVDDGQGFCGIGVGTEWTWVRDS